MNHQKFIRVGLGAVGVCLLLLVGLRPWSIPQPAVLVRAAGEGGHAAYLPLVILVLSPMSTTTPTAANSPTPTDTPSPTSTSTPTMTATVTGTPTVTNTATPTMTPTTPDTPTATNTATPTMTPTATGTSTATFTPTFTSTPTPTYTPTPTATTTFTITRVSVASDGTEGNERSIRGSISADGRFVVFTSLATNLVSDDTNGWGDVFVHDRLTMETSRISVASDGTEGNGSSGEPFISADGRYVVFSSSSNNLVIGDTNFRSDIFLHDRQTGETSRVSLASDGAQANHSSYVPAISADGRYIVFESEASNLVSNDTNGMKDIFVHDRQTGETSRVSVASGGVQGNGGSLSSAISADGRFVTFQSGSSNLVPDDTNGWSDIFVHDLQTGETSRVSTSSGGTQGNGYSREPSISADGRFIAYWSFANNLVNNDTNNTWDVFVYDQQTGQTTLVSVASDGTQGNDGSGDPSISADGRFVVFHTYASNLVSGDTNGFIDAFIHDRQTGQTSRISIAFDGAQSNEDSWVRAASDDGRFVVFDSGATNLVIGDTNGYVDIFVHDRGP